MRLLKYEGYNLTFEPEILTLKAFKRLHTRDRTKDKSKFLQELGYIYFMCDPRSDYQYITDEEERSKAIIEGEGLPNTWKVDPLLKDAIDYYSSFKPTSALLLEDTRVAVDKLRKLLREIDLSQVDDKGKPVYTLSSITSTIKQVPTLVKELDEAEKTLNSELNSIGRMRGQGNKTVFEDGIVV